MARYVPTSPSAPYLSLRWKALIVLSIVLVLVNTSLAFLAYRQAAEQFERQQREVRDRQARQLQALLEDGYRQMSRLANIVPLLGSDWSAQDIDGRLHQALKKHGFMLDLEWDIRSVHWIQPNGQPV
ncbi:MAG: GGDEF-domain containing protein, partial [Gammaproteobacteria bacterium]|nr:GGDEF-domain containing protein [Gammaproteobacteria bacterium]